MRRPQDTVLGYGAQLCVSSFSEASCSKDDGVRCGTTWGEDQKARSPGGKGAVAAAAAAAAEERPTPQQ